MKNKRKSRHNKGVYVLTSFDEFKVSQGETLYESYTDAMDAGKSLVDGIGFTVSHVMYNSFEGHKRKWEM